MPAPPPAPNGLLEMLGIGSTARCSMSPLLAVSAAEKGGPPWFCLLVLSWPDLGLPEPAAWAGASGGLSAGGNTVTPLS